MGIGTIADTVKEAFKEGVGKGRWPDHLVKSACARASMGAIGTDTHSELREVVEKLDKPEDKPYGLLEKAAYGLGYVYGRARG